MSDFTCITCERKVRGEQAFPRVDQVGPYTRYAADCKDCAAKRKECCSAENGHHPWCETLGPYVQCFCIPGEQCREGCRASCIAASNGKKMDMATKLTAAYAAGYAAGRKMEAA